MTQFRQTPKVLPACQYILGKRKKSHWIGFSGFLTFCIEHAQTPMVQFQVSLAIGDIAVRDYTLYEQSDLLRLKNYMIEYCLQRPT